MAPVEDQKPPESSKGGLGGTGNIFVRSAEWVRKVFLIEKEVAVLGEITNSHKARFKDIEGDLQQIFEDNARFFEKLQAQADQKIQSGDELSKLLEQYGKRFEETATQLNKRIDDTNARFDGLQKLIEMMVQAEVSRQKDK
jgi:predicted nuclease with TOPRIM domain